MVALLAFAVTLVIAVYVSGIAQGTVLSIGIANAGRIFHWIARVLTASSIVHSSTEVLLSRRLYGQQPEGARA